MKYKYEIKIIEPDRVQVQKWHNQSRSEQSGTFRFEEFQAQLNPLLKQVEQNDINGEGVIDRLGQTLFDVLFTKELFYDFRMFYQKAKEDKERLQIILNIGERNIPEVTALPWEFLRVPENASDNRQIRFSIDPHMVFSRYHEQPSFPTFIQRAKTENLRIALICSNPNNLDDLNLSKVIYEPIEKKLNTLKDEGLPVDILSVKDATWNNIYEILKKEPHLLHFIGHGRLKNKQAELALINADVYDTRWTSAQDFASLFSRYAPSVVILQACELGKPSPSSEFLSAASRLVAQDVSAVVAMQYEITNATANEFASNFYTELANGNSVGIAVQEGRLKIALKTGYNKRNFATPVLFMHADDYYLFDRIQTERASETSSQEQNNKSGSNRDSTEKSNCQPLPFQNSSEKSNFVTSSENQELCQPLNTQEEEEIKQNLKKESNELTDEEIREIIQNFQDLFQSLNNKKWEEANNKTLEIIYNSIQKEKSTSKLWSRKDIRQIPCVILLKIDKLWEKANSNFGFSAQKEQWEKAQKDLEKFRRIVGWSKFDKLSNKMVEYKRFDSGFKRNLKSNEKGILPTPPSRGSSDRINPRLVQYIIERLESCQKSD